MITTKKTTKHMIIKALKTKEKEKVLKAARKKDITYKGTIVRLFTWLLIRHYRDWKTME